MTMTDHHAPITDLAFNSDDSKLFTSSVDGQVFEWTVSAATTRRDKDFFLKNVCATHVTVSPSNAFILAAFRHTREVLKPQLLVKQNSEANLNINLAASMNMTMEGTSGRVRRESQEGRRRISKSASMGEDPGGVAGGDTSGYSFLVLWRDTITSNDAGEVVLQMEVPVTAISFGKLDGRHSPEVCVLGLANGSVLISMLPLPLRVFVPSIAKGAPSSVMHPFASFSRDQGSFRGTETPGPAGRKSRVGGGP